MSEEKEKTRANWEHAEKFIDQAITTLPAGVFALTISFRQNIVKTDKCLWLLQVTWAFLALAILVVMIGNLCTILFSEKRTLRIIRIMECKDMCEYNRLCSDRKSGQIVKWINITAVFSFSLGILSLAAYTIFSI